MMKKLALLITFIAVFSLQAGLASAQEGDSLEAPREEAALEVPKEFANMKSEGFTINPADPNAINPHKFIFEIKPGESIRDSVVIKNLSGEEATFYLYGADPTFSAQGTPAYKTRQAGGDGEGQWITFDESSVTLNPQEEKQVFFTLQVPADAELGDYRAGIAMEKTKQDVNNPNITIATRIILHSDIKVTDNPQPIAKMSGTQAASAGAAGKNTFQVFYFWISLILFIASFVALTWITFKEKKHPMETIRTGAVKDAAEKRLAATREGAARKAAHKRTASGKTARKKSSAGKSARKKTTQRPRSTRRFPKGE